MNLGLSLMFTAGSMTGVTSAFRRLTGLARDTDREMRILGQTVNQWKQDIHSALVMSGPSIVMSMMHGPDYNKLTTELEDLFVKVNQAVNRATAGTKLSRSEIMKWEQKVTSAVISLNRPIEDATLAMQALVHSHIDLKDVGLSSFQEWMKVVEIAGLDANKFASAVSQWKGVLGASSDQTRSFLDDITQIGIKGNLGAEALNYLVTGWEGLSPAIKATLGQEGPESFFKMARGAHILAAGLQEAFGGPVQSNMEAAWQLAQGIATANYDMTKTFAAFEENQEFSKFFTTLATNLRSVDEANRLLKEDPTSFILSIRRMMRETGGDPIFNQRIAGVFADTINPNIAGLLDLSKDVESVFAKLGNPSGSIAGAEGQFRKLSEAFRTGRNLTERTQLAVSLLNDTFRKMNRDRNTEIVDKHLIPAFDALGKKMVEIRNKGEWDQPGGSLLGSIIGKASDVDMMGSFLGLLPLGTERGKKVYVVLNLMSWAFGKLWALIGPVTAMVATFGSVLASVFAGSWLQTALTLDFAAVLGIEALGRMGPNAYKSLRHYTQALGSWTTETLKWLNSWVKKVRSWLVGEHSNVVADGVGNIAQRGMDRFKEIMGDFSGIQEAATELARNLFDMIKEAWPVFMDKVRIFWSANKQFVDAFRDLVMPGIMEVSAEAMSYVGTAMKDLGAFMAAEAWVSMWESTGTNYDSPMEREKAVNKAYHERFGGQSMTPYEAKWKAARDRSEEEAARASMEALKAQRLESGVGFSDEAVSILQKINDNLEANQLAFSLGL